VPTPFALETEHLPVFKPSVLPSAINPPECQSWRTVRL